ncbi:MAG: peptidase [Saprospiraceae bacterium]|nr:peptidase [Saprospiraceae bacterium]
MKTSTYYILLVLLGLFISCQKTVLGPTLGTSPESIFEQVWTDFDLHCGILHPKAINWDSLYTVYRPQVSPETTAAELWSVLSHLLDELDDEHTFVGNPGEDQVHVSGSTGIDYAIQSFSRSLIQEKYLSYSTLHPWAEDLEYGQVKDKSIGYIYLSDVDGYQPAQIIDDVLAEIGQHQAIIFDVRNNGGGQGDFARLITNAFADASRLVMTEQVRNGPEHDAFESKVELYTESDNQNQFTKPVVLLTDRFSVSGAEHIALYLKSNSHVTHIGGTTAGAFSTTGNRRFLPNGWEYQYPIEMNLDAEGKSLEGIGVIPDIEINNTPEDIAAGQDLVFEKALSFLQEKYGIK